MMIRYRPCKKEVPPKIIILTVVFPSLTWLLQLPEMCWRALVHLDIFHGIVLCETDLLFNKLYLQIYYRLLYRFNRYIVQ